MAARKAVPSKGPARKAAPKKEVAKEAAPKKEAAKKPAPETKVAKISRARPAKTPAAPVVRPNEPAAGEKPKAAPPAKAAAKKAAASRAPNPATANRTRVLIPMDVYEPQKDAIKAPFKEHGLKWTFLGEGKGLYKHPDGGIHCFTQFKDDGVHYTIWGADAAGVQAILATWRELLGHEVWPKATAGGEMAEAQEQAEKETEAVRAWKLAQPQPRPGEPDFFFKKRMAEWEAKRPT